MRPMAPNAFLRPCQRRARSAVVARDAHRRAPLLGRAPRRRARRPRGPPRAVHLDQQHRGGVGRVSGGVDRCLHRADRRRSIISSAAGRCRWRRSPTPRAPPIDGREVREQRANRLRIRVRRTVTSSATPKHPSNPRRRRAGRSLGSPSALAERDDSPREKHGQRDDVVERHPVLEAVRSARVLGHVAADRARALAGRIGRVVQSVRGDGADERGVHDAGFDDGEPVLRVDRDDARERLRPMQHGAVRRARRRRGPCPRRAGHESAAAPPARARPRSARRACPERPRARLLVIAGKRVGRVHTSSSAGRAITPRAPTIVGEHAARAEVTVESAGAASQQSGIL